VRDGRLITGQQQYSARKVAEMFDRIARYLTLVRPPPAIKRGAQRRTGKAPRN
jgi:hypothetical protein